MKTAENKYTCILLFIIQNLLGQVSKMLSVEKKEEGGGYSDSCDNIVLSDKSFNITRWVR